MSDGDAEMINTGSRPQAETSRYMPQRPQRKLPLYIPRIMADLIWATTKDSTSVHFGFGHKCLFNLEHIRTCS